MMIKVERGKPTAEELAVVVALVQASAAAVEAAADEGDDTTAWADPARNVPGSAPRPGRSTWRTSAWPA